MYITDNSELKSMIERGPNYVLKNKWTQLIFLLFITFILGCETPQKNPTALSYESVTIISIKDNTILVVNGATKEDFNPLQPNKVVHKYTNSTSEITEELAGKGVVRY